MDYSDIKISRKQAQQFALAIIADIKEYVEQHQSEFEAFLAADKEGGENSG